MTSSATEPGAARTSPEDDGLEAGLGGAPCSPNACFEAGARLAERGRLDEAERWFARAIELGPAMAEAHLNLGVIAERRGDLGEATRRYERAVELDPGSALAAKNLSIALGRRARAAAAAGSPLEAIRLHEQAVLRDPRSADAWQGLGAARLAAGDRAQAEVCYEVALLADPDRALAHNDLGVILQARGDLARAAACFEHAAALDPARREPCNNLGVLHLLHRRYGQARPCFRRALALSPRYAEAWNNLGVLAADLGDLGAALRCTLRATRCDPSAASPEHNLLRTLRLLPGISPERVEARHATWGRAFSAHRPPVGPPAGISLDPERPLRVGYLSPDLHAHSVSYFLDGVLASHGPDVAAHCYSAGPRVDDRTIHLQGLARAWRSVDGASAEEVARRIRDDGIDLLVDLAGHTSGNRLDVMALRPAPVQLTYLGYPGSTGLPTIDYRLTDAIVDPPGEDHAGPEQPAWIDGCFVCYTPSGPVPEVAPGPRAAGMAPTFASFHDLARVNDRVLAAWARILAALPGARILLKAKGLSDPDACARLRARLSRAGVSPDRVACRSPTESREEHLATYAEADVALDTFPYAGATTTCEALLMGVPVVTLAGRAPAGNVGRSLLHAAGLPELVAGSVDDYVALAVALASDGPRLTALRRELRARLLASRLCDARGFTRDLEARYRALWRRYCAEQTAPRRFPARARAAAAAPADGDDALYARLLSWLTDQGARVAPLRLGRSEGGERGIYAAAPIASGQSVMDIPRRCILSTEVARASSIGAAIAASGVVLRSPRTYLAAFLLTEGREEASFWAPYLDSLPASFRHLPVLFDDRELSLLAGTAALDRVRVRRAALAEELAICRAIPALRGFTDAEITHAFLAVDTRIFGMVSQGEKIEGLVPLADLLNHRHPRETSWGLVEGGGERFRVTAIRGFAEGEAVHDSYGVKCRARFFVNYGFVPGPEAVDEVVLRPRIEPGSPFTSPGFPAQATTRSAATRRLFSALRIAHGAPARSARYAPPVSTANEETVLRTLAEACDEALAAFPTTAAEDDALLSGQPLSANERAAIQVRRGEKHALADLADLSAFAASLLRLPAGRERRAVVERRPAGGRFDDYLALLVDLPRRPRRVRR